MSRQIIMQIMQGQGVSSGVLRFMWPSSGLVKPIKWKRGGSLVVLVLTVSVLRHGVASCQRRDSMKAAKLQEAE